MAKRKKRKARSDKGKPRGKQKQRVGKRRKNSGTLGNVGGGSNRG